MREDERHGWTGISLSLFFVWIGILFVVEEEFQFFFVEKTFYFFDMEAYETSFESIEVAGQWKLRSIVIIE